MIVADLNKLGNYSRETGTPEIVKYALIWSESAVLRVQNTSTIKSSIWQPGVGLVGEVTLSFILSCHTSRHASLEATGWRHRLESDWMRLFEYAKGRKNGIDIADMRSKLFLSSNVACSFMCYRQRQTVTPVWVCVCVLMCMEVEHTWTLNRFTYGFLDVYG